MTPAMLGYTSIPNFGGYVDYNFSGRWGVKVGAQAYRSSMTNRIEAQPIVTPTTKSPNMQKSASTWAASSTTSSKTPATAHPAATPPSPHPSPVPHPSPQEGDRRMIQESIRVAINTSHWLIAIDLNKFIT